MTPEEFRRHGYQVIDWIAEYMQHVDDYPVLSRVKPGEVRSSLSESPPEQAEPFDRVLRDLDEIILPGITHWQSPGFFAYFPGNNSGPSILGELLSAGLGVQGMMWVTSPACTELETHVLDWLVGMLDLPAPFKSSSTGGGVIKDGASSSTLCALLAARERTTQWTTNATGVRRPLVAYTSNQAHSSVEKAVRVAGIGGNNLRLVEVDDTFAILPDRLVAMIAEDRASGNEPFFVCATVGSTSSMAVDPLRAIGDICRKNDVWLHVDAAMAGTAALCPELREIHDGLELADSYCFNPHKWMLTNVDCSAFYVARRADLIRTLSVLPEYLRNEASESGEVFDYRDWHIELGRRFRALKLWLVIRSYGVEGLRAMVREHIALAEEFAKWVGESPLLELAAPPRLNLVCFRHVSGDRATRQVLDTVNESGRAYMTHTDLGGRMAIRMCIGQAKTRLEHVERAWQLIESGARDAA